MLFIQTSVKYQYSIFFIHEQSSTIPFCQDFTICLTNSKHSLIMCQHIITIIGNIPIQVIAVRLIRIIICSCLSQLFSIIDDRLSLCCNLHRSGYLHQISCFFFWNSFTINHGVQQTIFVMTAKKTSKCSITAQSCISFF